MAENENSEMVTLTIDGREVSVPKGTTLLKAAESLGTRVPHYCYHEGLSSPAMCRLCLVEVEGAPKLQPSCVTPAMPGQVVHTGSEKAEAMRRGVLEFYLVNHPLDCPICDQSGECKLQDYVHAEGRRHGRSREPKRVFGRDDFGGDVLFYGDRCVMCTRCVRFMNEMEQDPRLTVVERGSRSVIDTFFDEGLDGTNWSGNIVDICPVGALVSKDFLYKQRAWDLDHTPSICPSCSQGCNIELHTRDNLVQRLKPRANMAVNAFWMCDRGRADYEFMNRDGRLDAPVVQRDGVATRVGWKEALAALLEAARAVGGPVRAVASPLAANEDLGALAALVEALGGGEVVYRMPRAEAEIPLKGMPALARRRDLAPNGTGAGLLGASRVGDDRGAGGLADVAGHRGIVLVLGDALEDQAEGFASDASLYVYLGTHPVPAAAGAHFQLPVTSFAEQEGTFTNLAGRVQRFWPGLHAPGAARPAWLVLGALVAELREAPVPTTAAEAFRTWVAPHPPFAGMDFHALGTRGAVVNEPVPATGG
ncbi:MAG: 2Fe-2S iron-sulfur cluster-binding protein [Longimicrobiales bacterium]|nr:2Fe-2S iron-sulfur cluster-binding protein [Longimicrobiales bacterium]